MVWVWSGQEFANVVLASLELGAMPFYRVHDEFHNGANMSELGEIVARHQPHFERAEDIRAENAHKPRIDIAENAGKSGKTEIRARGGSARLDARRTKRDACRFFRAREPPDGPERRFRARKADQVVAGYVLHLAGTAARFEIGRRA